MSYIDQDATAKALLAMEKNASERGKSVIQMCITKVLGMFPADVTPVERGYWCWITEDIYRCDNCGEMAHVKEVMGEPDWDYCPNCGARMGGGSDG